MATLGGIQPACAERGEPMTLKQRRLSKMLGEPWHADYTRRKADGWPDREIAAYYRIQLGALSESAVTKWARKERKQGSA